MRRSYSLLVSVAVSVWMVIFLFWNKTKWTSYRRDRTSCACERQRDSKELRTLPRDSNTTTILLWTGFFSSADWFIDLDKPFKNEHCEYSDCVFTRNTALLHQSNALMFHCRNDPGNWPEVRYPEQIYAMYCAESPTHAGMSLYNNKMNLTASFRLDSDIPTRYYFLEQKDFVPYVRRIPFQSKTKLAVWPASNCYTASKREQLIAELSKHIPIDVFGTCGSHVCPKTESERCFEEFEKSYKFFFAFENCVCQDYVTEKFFLPLKYELVPVVFGGADYMQHAPPHSHINARDFNSIAELVTFLTDLANNEVEYNKYFEWKARYRVVAHGLGWYYCELCRIAKSKMYRKQYSDLQGWWAYNKCDNAAVYKLLSK